MNESEINVAVEVATELPHVPPVLSVPLDAVAQMYDSPRQRPSSTEVEDSSAERKHGSDESGVGASTRRSGQGMSSSASSILPSDTSPKATSLGSGDELSGSAAGVSLVDAATGKVVIFAKAGNFRKGGALGKGSFGVVSELIHKHSDRVFALKTQTVDVRGLKEDHKMDANSIMVHSVKTLADGVREALLTAKFRDPYVVSLYHAYTSQSHKADGSYNLEAGSVSRDHSMLYNVHMIMELMCGGTLSSAVKSVSGNGLPPSPWLHKWAFQMCMGLDAVHKHGYVHQDLKPDNILCTANKDIKIADLGGAVISGHQGGAMTKLFQAPEQVMGAVNDQMYDIWAAGMILMCVAKRVCFKGDDLGLIIEAKDGSHKILGEWMLREALDNSDKPPMELLESIPHPQLAQWFREGSALAYLCKRLTLVDRSSRFTAKEAVRFIVMCDPMTFGEPGSSEAALAKESHMEDMTPAELPPNSPIGRRNEYDALQAQRAAEAKAAAEEQETPAAASTEQGKDGSTPTAQDSKEENAEPEHGAVKVDEPDERRGSVKEEVSVSIHNGLMDDAIAVAHDVNAEQAEFVGDEEQTAWLMTHAEQYQKHFEIEYTPKDDVKYDKQEIMKWPLWTLGILSCIVIILAIYRSVSADIKYDVGNVIGMLVAVSVVTFLLAFVAGVPSLVKGLAALPRVSFFFIYSLDIILALVLVGFFRDRNEDALANLCIVYGVAKIVTIPSPWRHVQIDRKLVELFAKSIRVDFFKEYYFLGYIVMTTFGVQLAILLMFMVFFVQPTSLGDLISLYPFIWFLNVFRYVCHFVCVRVYVNHFQETVADHPIRDALYDAFTQELSAIVACSFTAVTSPFWSFLATVAQCLRWSGHVLAVTCGAVATADNSDDNCCGVAAGFAACYAACVAVIAYAVEKVCKFFLTYCNKYLLTIISIKKIGYWDAVQLIKAQKADAKALFNTSGNVSNNTFSSHITNVCLFIGVLNFFMGRQVESAAAFYALVASYVLGRTVFEPLDSYLMLGYAIWDFRPELLPSFSQSLDGDLREVMGSVNRQLAEQLGEGAPKPTGSPTGASLGAHGNGVAATAPAAHMASPTNQQLMGDGPNQGHNAQTLPQPGVARLVGEAASVR